METGLVLNRYLKDPTVKSAHSGYQDQAIEITSIITQKFPTQKSKLVYC